MRIGAVTYLNTKPLIYRFERHCPRGELVFDLPSRLADRLAAGELDVALIPSIECLRHPDYQIISDACIACHGPVLSVKLLMRVPPDAIRTLALDEGSRTSGALARILLKQRFGRTPDVIPLPMNTDLSDCPADAILLIGDRAIHSPRGQFAEVWDLGDQWCRWSGLPMVFAMWVARRDRRIGGLADVLRAVRDDGVDHVEKIAEREAPCYGLTFPECLSYLRDNLYFRLGPREREGLHLFYNHARRQGLTPDNAPSSVTNCSVVP